MLFLFPSSRKFLLLLVLVMFPLFLQLGDRGLNEPDEGRYSEMGREMMVTGDWLIPRLNGVPHYAKPPWIYWSVAASLKLFGVNEWAARLPSALAAVATALTVFSIGRRMGGERAGWIAALSLTSSLLFFFIARLITPDMTLTACITLALYCFWRWWTSEPRDGRWLVGLYLLLGIGFLDKGLVPLGVVFLSILGFLLLQKKGAALPKLGLVRGLLLVALIGLPWFFILCQLNPDLFDFYLVGEVKDRILSGRGRTRAWWYHLLWLPGDCWPWTFLTGCAAWFCVREWRLKDRLATPSLFLLSWFFFPLVMFSVSSSKLPTYILPLMIPLHLMLGLWLGRLWDENQAPPAWSRWITCLFLPFPVAAAVWYFNLRPSSPSLFLIAGTLGIGIFLGILAQILFHKRGLPAFLVLCWAVSLLSLHSLIWNMESFETRLGHNSSWRSITRALEGRDLVGIPIPTTLHPSERTPLFERSGPRVAMYEFYDRSASFYLMKNRAEIVPLYAGNSLWEIARDIEAEKKPTRDDLIALLKGPDPVYVLTRPRHHEELRALTRMELPLIKSAGREKGDHRVVLFSNR